MTVEYTPTEEGGSPDGPIATVWSSTDGLDWTAELILEKAGIADIAANDDRVLVQTASPGGLGRLWIAESGQPFAPIVGPPIPVSEAHIFVATDDGFVVGTRSAVFTTTDGAQWGRTDLTAMLPIVTRWVSHGTLILGAKGEWKVEHLDGGVTTWIEPTGIWILGHTLAPG